MAAPLKQSVRFLDLPPESPSGSQSLSASRSAPFRTADYPQTIRHFYDSKYRSLFERSDLPLLKTLFLEEGYPGVLVGCARKPLGRCALGRFNDTYAKLKIFISKNFGDLKKAFLYYHSRDGINFYQSYNDFIERIGDSGSYKAQLRRSSHITLFEAESEDFEIERVRFSATRRSAEAGMKTQANFYHKLAFYRYFRKLETIDPPVAEKDLLRELQQRGRKAFMDFLMFRIWMLLQTVFERVVDDFEVSFFFDRDNWAILSFDRLQITPESFANSETDEDDFEVVNLQTVDLNDPRRSTFARRTRLALTGFDQEPIEFYHPNPKFQQAQARMREQSNKLMTTIREDFDRMLAEKYESDVCFQRLFPQTKVPLSVLLKYEDTHGLLAEYTSKHRQMEPLKSQPTG